MSIHCHENKNGALYAHNAYWYHQQLLDIEQAYKCSLWGEGTTFFFFSFGCCDENPVTEIVFAKLQVGNTTKQATKHLNV